MKNGMAALLLGMTLVASPASAQTVLLQDNFNGENGGSSSVLNYTGFANWNVTGQVDLVRSGSYGITCNGMCVDLDGSSGPGALTSKISYSFAAGDVIRFRALVGGSQRSSSADAFSMGVKFNAAVGLGNAQIEAAGNTTILGNFLGSANAWTNNFSSIPGTAGFAWYGMSFTAQNAGSVSFEMRTTSGDNIGPLVDEMIADRTSARVPEPASVLLVVTGLAGLASVRKRRASVS